MNPLVFGFIIACVVTLPIDDAECIRRAKLAIAYCSGFGLPNATYMARLAAVKAYLDP